MLNTMEDLFPHKDGIDYHKLKLTEEGAYSITRKADSDKILTYMRTILQTLDDKTITDATGGMGGDTISFCMNFKYVHSIEINKNNYAALKSNVIEYGLKNVTLYNADATRSYDWYTDVLFVDPPWGGPGYKEYVSLDLFMSEKRLDDWIEEVLCRKNRPSYVFLKLPKNYNFQRLMFLSNVRGLYHHQIRKFILVCITISQDKIR